MSGAHHTPSAHLTWNQVAAWRMRRQHLTRRLPAASILQVASRLCGLHAQVLSCAELTLWARVDGLERGAVRRALWEERTLVKTWAMRGTLHLLPAEELPIWHGALSTSKRYWKPAQWLKHYGLTMEDLDRITHAIGEALAGQTLTREELAAEVGRICEAPHFAGKLAESSWGTVLKPAAFTGRLCFSPSTGQRVRFTRPDTWLGKSHPLHAPEAAIPEITRRFLGAFGPASERDLALWWGGGSIRETRRWLAALGDEVTAVNVEGVEAWMLAADVPGALESQPEPAVRLLPGFDQYVVACSPHAGRLMAAALRSSVYRPQGWISPVLLVDGRMEGVWRHVESGNRVEVAVAPFGRQPARVRRAAEREANRLADYLGRELRFEWQ